MEAKCMEVRRTVPVRHEVDVFVAGGGPAGCAAAVFAARQGARVFLAEGQNCFGGMGTCGMVPAFMAFGNGIHFLAAGFGEDLLDRLIADGGAGDLPAKYNKTGCFSIDAEKLKRVYDGLVGEAGVTFGLHTHLIGVETEGGRVTAALLWGKSGLFAVQARVYVDATGDGDLAAWAGAPFEKGDADGNLMPGTLCSLWANVDFQQIAADKLGWDHNRHIEQAWKDGVLSYCDKHLPGMWAIRKNIGGGNIGHTFGVDGTDERSLTAALVKGRQLLVEYENYYKRYLGSGFRDMDLVASGSLLGVRETRRIQGDYVLALDDFKTRATFTDEIGRYNYPVDIHVGRPNDEREYQRFEKEFASLRMGVGESYGIPFRCLVPRGLENVLVAGRCISTDRSMQASIRVMPGSFITGQAAGIAAAMAASTPAARVREVVADELRGRLRKAGAYLPAAANETGNQK